jgi:hypothetical protein
MTKLLQFQREFIKAVENPRYDTVAISGPRSLGKTFIAAEVLIRCLTPGDSLHVPAGTANVYAVPYVGAPNSKQGAADLTPDMVAVFLGKLREWEDEHQTRIDWLC